MCGHQAGKLFEILLVGLVECVQLIAVYVQHAPEPPLSVEHGHDDFRTAERRAGNMPGKRLHVGHDDGLSLR